MVAQTSQDAEAKLDLLLQQGVDLQSTTQSGMGLSHMACLQGSLRILRKASTDLKSSINRKDNCGNSPLHYAASSQSSDPDVVDCVNYLVSLGANVDAENNSRWTPLDTALKFKKKNVVIALVRAGASLPLRHVAVMMTTDQLSILAELDVIAASKKPIIAALKTAGLMQKMHSEIDEDYYRELAKTLEETASRMLTLDVKSVSEVTDEVLLVAVENNQKQVSLKNCCRIQYS